MKYLIYTIIALALVLRCRCGVVPTERVKHTANSVGCILVGENREKGRVLNSTSYEVAITAKIKEAIRRGERVTIEVL